MPQELQYRCFILKQEEFLPERKAPYSRFQTEGVPHIRLWGAILIAYWHEMTWEVAVASYMRLNTMEKLRVLQCMETKYLGCLVRSQSG